MRKILLLLCLYCAAFSANAQWKKGYYYTVSGQQIHGLLTNYIAQEGFSGLVGKTLFFKSHKGSSKVKLDVDSLASFVVTGKDTTTLDSFVVSHNPLMEKTPFLKVTINNSVKLYAVLYSNSTSMTAAAGGGLLGALIGSAASSTLSKYYFGATPHDVVKMDKKNFAEGMSQIVADKPVLVKMIQDEKLKFRDMKTIIQFYNTGFWPDNKNYRHD